MSTKFFSNDLPAARAYEADQLARYGYEDEARKIRKDTSPNLPTSAFIHNCITSVVTILMNVWANIL